MSPVQTQPQPVTEADASPLAGALARFQAEMPTVPKLKVADAGTYRYNYADLADVTQAALPLLTAQGLSFVTVPRYTEHGMELVGVLLHSSGESMEGALPIHGNSAQQLGSAITYARRYLFGCMTGVVTDDDDDGQAASGKAPRTTRKKAAAEPPERAPGQDPRLASTPQKQKIMALMKELGLSQRAAALDYVEGVIGRRVGSRNELTVGEASAVIEALQTRGAPAPQEQPVGSGTGEASPPTVDPWAEGPTGPPRPVDPEGAAYAERAREEAQRAVGVQDVHLPDAEPEQEQAPVRPPALVTAPTAERIHRLLRHELGDVASEAEERSLLAAIVGHPVESVETLSRADGQAVGGAFARFKDKTLAWEFDLDDESPTPRIIISDVNVTAVQGDGAP